MKPYELGYTLIEVVVALCIIGLVAGGAATATYQAIKNTERTNNHLTAMHNAGNTGYWINRDAQMSDYVQVTDLTYPAFLILKWTEWGYDTDTAYHSVTYSMEDISQNIGRITRTHQDSLGHSVNNQISEYVYYNAADPDNSTSVSYTDSILSLKTVIRYRDTEEILQYQNYCRPNY